MGRMVNTRRHDNVPRWLDRIVAAGAVLLIILVAVAAALAVSNVARADELPPGYFYDDRVPEWPCSEETGTWSLGAPAPLPCGWLLDSILEEDPLPQIDPETGCTPMVASVGCPGDTPPTPALAAPVETQGCVGDPDYCAPPSTEPATTTTVAPSTSTTVPAPSTTAAPSTTTTVAPSTSTTTSVAVGPPPTPAPTTTVQSVALPPPTTAPAPIGVLPVTGNTSALWKLLAGAAAVALGTILVSGARRR